MKSFLISIFGKHDSLMPGLDWASILLYTIPIASVLVGLLVGYFLIKRLNF